MQDETDKVRKTCNWRAENGKKKASLQLRFAIDLSNIAIFLQTESQHFCNRNLQLSCKWLFPFEAGFRGLIALASLFSSGKFFCSSSLHAHSSVNRRPGKRGRKGRLRSLGSAVLNVSFFSSSKGLIRSSTLSIGNQGDVKYRHAWKKGKKIHYFFWAFYTRVAETDNKRSIKLRFWTARWRHIRTIDKF